MGSGDTTSAPYTAQASGGGLVTIPQGSAISDIAPTLTNFQQQPDPFWGNLLKGVVGNVAGGYRAGMPQAPPAAGGTGMGGATLPPIPKPNVAAAGRPPAIPTMLGQIDPVVLKASVDMLKRRLMGF